ncbi:MAG: DUF4232 domain-containing protein [Gemmatimonadota bacterium]
MKTALITVLAAIGTLTCACSSGGSAAPQATVTVTASQPAQPAAGTPSAPPASAQAASAAPPASAPVPAATPCSTRYLGAAPAASPGGAAAGSTYLVLDFKNLNNSPCTLYGYPGVSLGGGTPVTQIGLSAAENPATARVLVTLPPQGHAYALLQIVQAANYPASTCAPVTAHWLIIYPPNQTVPIYLGYKALTCAKNIRILTVSTVRSSSGSL